MEFTQRIQLLRLKKTYAPLCLLQHYLHKIRKQPKCPSVDEWIKKMWYIYTMEYYSAKRRKQILPFATTWMELEGIMLSEISQAEKDKCQMISLICGVYEQTKKLKEQNSSRLTKPKNGLTVTKGKRTGEDG